MFITPQKRCKRLPMRSGTAVVAQIHYAVTKCRGKAKVRESIMTKSELRAMFVPGQQWRTTVREADESHPPQEQVQSV